MPVLKRKPKPTAKRKPRKPATTCRTVRDKRTGRKKRVTRRTATQPRVSPPQAAPVPRPVAGLPVPSAAALPATVAALAGGWTAWSAATNRLSSA